MEDKSVFTTNQLKQVILKDYMKALEGKSDGEALVMMLEELALMFAANTSLRGKVEKLEEEQQNIQKWIANQYFDEV